MEDERRKRALRYLNITDVVQCLLGLLLLFLGLAAQIRHGPYAEGVPPYYTGAFIGMATLLIQAGLGVTIFIRGKDCLNKLEAAEKIGCVMQAYCLMAIISEIGFLVASLLVGFNGICYTSKCSYIETGENQRLAITILVFICVGVITSAIGLAIVCKYSSSFGLKMLSRGQYQISNLVDNTDAVIAYIAAEQTTGNDVTENQEPVHQHHHYHQEQHHHHDPRLELQAHDYSTHHLQHYLTQQYRDRIRKRRKKNRKRNRENQQAGGEGRRRRNGRETPYILPPLSAPSGNYDHQPSSPTRTPPPPPPSPPPIPVHFPPPSPSPSETKTPPRSRRTPPLTPSSLPLPEIIPPSESPPPDHSSTQSPSPPPPPPPTPPLTHPGIIHVIPCGEDLDDEPPPYSP